MQTENGPSAPVETIERSQPAIQLNSPGTGKTALWVLASVVVGFLLPVCSCAVLTVAGIAGLGVLGSSSSVSSTGSGDAVAVVEVEGTISSGDKEDYATGAVSGTVIDDLRQASEDVSVKAIVLRVDSPGGTVTGSAQIYEALLAMEKPVVVSMGGVAASGGYYVSAPADFIYARPDTVTGSLGVIMTLYNAEELIDEIGVDVITITSGPNKSMGGTWDELTPDQREIFEQFIDESYNDFVQIVADGRGLDVERVRELADGRIYSGRQAVDNGLADGLGNLNDAIQKAADLGGITGTPRIIEYQHIPPFEQILFGISSRIAAGEADQIIETISKFTTPSIEYRYVGP